MTTYAKNILTVFMRLPRYLNRNVITLKSDNNVYLCQLIVLTKKKKKENSIQGWNEMP